MENISEAINKLEVIERMKGVFAKLVGVDVSSKVEKKNNLSYLSWAYAWGEIKKEYPLANYAVYDNKDGLNYHHDGKTAWVRVGVTIEGLEHREDLPVMNNYNKSIPLGEITSFDVNKSIQRAVTKAIARHGLGLYIYAGEDLPESQGSTPAPKSEPRPVSAPSRADTEPRTIIEKLSEVKPTKSDKFFTLVFANGLKLGCGMHTAAEANKALEADHKVSVEYGPNDKGYMTCLSLVEVIPQSEAEVPF